MASFAIEWLDEFMSIMEAMKTDIDEEEIDSVFEYQVYIRCLAELTTMGDDIPTPRVMADKYFPMLVNGKFT